MGLTIEIFAGGWVALKDVAVAGGVEIHKAAVKAFGAKPRCPAETVHGVKGLGQFILGEINFSPCPKLCELDKFNYGVLRIAALALSQETLYKGKT